MSDAACPRNPAGHAWYGDLMPSRRGVQTYCWCVCCGVPRELPVGAAARKYIEAYGCSRDEVRTLLYDRQDGECGICRGDLPRGYLRSAHVNLDHIRPRCHGGPDHIDNLQIVHRDCNQAKGETCAGCEGCPEE